MVEYFWEYDYKFGAFLQKIFPNTYKRKYSMTGNGIYNLVVIQDKVYDVKFSETKETLGNNDILTTDVVKNKIIENICKNLKSEYSINNGKITFKMGKWIAKVEIVKKVRMPE